MKIYSLAERANFYKSRFPTWPCPRTDSRWLDGIWVLGNNYKGSGYFGAYPPNYLTRITALFPDAERILHLFSGSLPKGNYVRFDTNEPADVLGDANLLSSYFKPDSFDLILADPPYSSEDADHYGTPMINRNKVISECVLILESGGYIVWLDQVLPMFRKQTLNLCGLIGIVRSTNHRFRVASIFQKNRNRDE